MTPRPRHDATIMAGLASTLFALLLLAGPLAAQTWENRTVTLESTELGQSRDIMIFEPLNYHDGEGLYYDVIYVFDAQLRMFFDYVSAIANLSKAGPRGFIVVGITATALDDERYYRNHDLLPAGTTFGLPTGTDGNADGFLRYVKNEVIPYVESEYRVLRNRTAIGHSLSASFLVWTMLQEPDLFDNWIAVSPNLHYDDQRLVRGLREFDSGRVDDPTLFYLSYANEGGPGSQWGPSYDAAWPLLQDTLATENLRVVTERYPDETHMSGFVPSVSSAMRTYLTDVWSEQSAELSEETYEVTFRVEVPDEEDDIWISGNQPSLGDWATRGLRMERVAPRVREFSATVHDHVEVRFYRATAAGSDGGTDVSDMGEGDMDHEDPPMARVQVGEPESWGIPWTNWPRMLRPEEGGVYEFTVIGYND